jgi:DNA polymerase III, epsilon subunit and related 3''-5'' exonucleases
MTPAAPALRNVGSRRGDWRSAELVALDFETTGLDLDRDEVISFGLIPSSAAASICRGSCYQEVAPGVEPSRSSIPIHHLRAQDLATAPRCRRWPSVPGRPQRKVHPRVGGRGRDRVPAEGVRRRETRLAETHDRRANADHGRRTPVGRCRPLARLLRALRGSNEVRGAGRTDAPCARRRLHDGGTLLGSRQRLGSRGRGSIRDLLRITARG